MNSYQGKKRKRLENISHIYPATWTRKDPKVFRIACELTQPAKRDILQSALDQIIEEVSLYKSVLRKGLYWYHIEKSDIRPEVLDQTTAELAPIYLSRRDKLLFRVYIKNNRVNLEVFHSLSDGVGALRFFETLITRYMTLLNLNKHEDAIKKPDAALRNMQTEDSFRTHFTSGGAGERSRRHKEIRAYQIQGVRLPESRFNIIEGAVSAAEVLAEARKNAITLTGFLASIYVYAITKELDGRATKHPVVLTVPADLRKHYESRTLRNFFSFVNIESVTGADGLDTIIKKMRLRFMDALTKEQLDLQTNKYMAMERSMVISMLPLPIKDLIARGIFGFSRRYATSMVSNIGKVDIAPEFRAYIRQFSFCTSDVKPQMGICTYEDRLVISFSSPFRDTRIQEAFFHKLSDCGIDVDIASND